MPKKATTPFVLADALLFAFDTNERINQHLLDNLQVEAWRAEPPVGKGRAITGVMARTTFGMWE